MSHNDDNWTFLAYNVLMYAVLGASVLGLIGSFQIILSPKQHMVWPSFLQDCVGVPCRGKCKRCM